MATSLALQTVEVLQRTRTMGAVHRAWRRARTVPWFCLTLTGLVGGVLLACGGTDRPPDYTEDIVTTKFGDTCGEWQTEEGPHRTSVTCGKGLECGVVWSVTDPFDAIPNQFGICVPPNSTCSFLTGEQCSDDRLACQLGMGVPSPGACFVKCAVPQDCRGPFQTCDVGGCRFVGCANHPEACSIGTHCELELCVPD
jgi:hypothetical protein